MFDVKNYNKQLPEGNRVYAKWKIAELPDDMTEFYIQCGIESEDRSEDWLSYTIDDQGAELTIQSLNTGYFVIFSAPSLGHENNEGFWLSPAYINDKHEAEDFGEIAS